MSTATPPVLVRAPQRALRLLGLALLLGACSDKFAVLLPRDEPTGVADAGLDGQRPGVDAEIGRDARADAPDAQADAGTPLVRERKVAAFAHTCAVFDRALYCWGEDTDAQVGVPGDGNDLVPLRVDTGAFVDVCAGEQHSCALRADGVVLCWGDNARGQLGVGDLLRRELPTELNSSRFSSLACGGRGSCALTPRGELYCWGENVEGRLGQGDPVDAPSPDSPKPLPVRADLRFQQVSLGQGHVCALTTEGALYCWGRNSQGQLGLSDNSVQLRAPAEVEAGTRFAFVAAGQRHSCAVDSGGKLYCWGENSAALLGLNSDQPIVRRPTLVGDSADYTAVSAGWFHSCAMKKSGSLVCWGRNEEGQLGLGDTTPRPLPTQTGPAQVFRSVAVGQFHTCAFSATRLLCWGANDSGQLGLGDSARRYVPIGVVFP